MQSKIETVKQTIIAGSSSTEAAKPRFIPRWRKMTWALVIFSLLMAVFAIVAGAAVMASENVGEAEIGPCMQGGMSFFGPVEPSSRAECEDQLSSADDVVSLIFILWLIGFVVLSLFWFKKRPPSLSEARPSGSLRTRP